jgi:hypothetical protein
LLHLALFCQEFSKNTHFTITPETLAKQGIPGQNKENQNYDKNTIHLPRHSSFMIMHTFADWGNTGQNMAESFGITTV